MNNYQSLIASLSSLGITEADCQACRIPWHPEANDIVEAGLDMFERKQQMTQDTLTAWILMKNAAQHCHVELQLVSAFRSIEYQTDLIKNKLENGREISDILNVNAIPGFSEHHTGRALDLSTPGFTPLEVEFETSPAFNWLSQHASNYGFYMSYPKDNELGIIYEPWHWAFTTNSESKA